MTSCLQVASSLTKFGEELRESLTKITGSLNCLKEGQQALHSDMQMLHSDMGGMLERQLRKDIKVQFGDQYAKRLLARSIMDFTHLFLEGAIQPNHNDNDDRIALLMPAIKVCTFLFTALRAHTMTL